MRAALAGALLGALGQECNDIERIRASDELGEQYRGCQTRTVSGRLCQSWGAQSPQEHSFTPEAYPFAGLGSHNFCRNPLSWLTIWCLTTDVTQRWEECAPIGEEAAAQDFNPVADREAAAERAKREQAAAEVAEAEEVQRLRQRVSVVTESPEDPYAERGYYSSTPGPDPLPYVFLAVAVLICGIASVATCCAYATRGPKGPVQKTVTPPVVARTLASVAPMGAMTPPRERPSPAKSPPGRGGLNSSFNMSLPRTPRLPFFMNLGRNPQTGCEVDAV